jgi:hypothetical protein
MIGIFMLFFIPPMAAVWLNAYQPDWNPFGHSNHGDLIQPAVRVQVNSLKALDGSSFDANFLSTRWTMVYLDSGSCESACEKALTVMRQLRLALGKDRERIQRLFIGLENGTEIRSRRVKLLAQFPGLRIAEVMDNSPLKLNTRDVTGAIWLIDPRSFLMMQFPVQIPTSDILKDLQRLVKLSKRD